MNVADHATVLQAIRALVAGARLTAAAFPADNIIRVLRAVFPLGPNVLPDIVPVDYAATVLATAIDMFKFVLGPNMASAPENSGEQSSYAWFCTTTFSDARIAATRAGFFPRQGVTRDDQHRDGERALSAAALKNFRIVERHKGAWTILFIRPMFQSEAQSDSTAAQSVFSTVATTVADLEPVLAPALVPADDEGLPIFVELIVGAGISGEAAATVGALAATAAGADPRDEARAKARARLLGALDCAYL